MRRARRRAGGGFSLLEVMVAIAILAGALVIILNIVTRNVRATNHAKLTSTATFLARAKIVELEDEVLRQGFVDTDEEDDGDFSEEGFPQFRWHTLVEKVELPTDVTQKAQDKAQDQTTSNNPMEMMAGFMGGFMSTLIEPIRVGIEESVRRVTVVVTWDEIGRGEQSIDVVTFMTDPAKLDLAMAAVPGAGGTAGAAGTTGAGGAGGGGTQQGGQQQRPQVPTR